MTGGALAKYDWRRRLHGGGSNNYYQNRSTHIYTVPKMSLLCLAITLTYMNRFGYFLAEMLLRK